MLFAFFCTDKPNAAQLRAETRSAHKSYLEDHMDHLVVAGPTLTNDQDGMNGSLLIMDFPDQAAAEAFAEGDPYAQAGLFESVIIRPWKKVFPEV